MSISVRIHSSPLSIQAEQWNALLARSDAPTPFMRHEYLAALHESASACTATGWLPRFVALHDDESDELLAACPLYVKDHSYGEYVFDWAWAQAYEQHGLSYYPKAVIAVPYTPVPGTRILSKNAELSSRILLEALSFCEQEKLSSLHMLFASAADDAWATSAPKPLMPREAVQFHWRNDAGGRPYANYEEFLNQLAQDKRKKVRAEQRKVREAGVTWRFSQGAAITDEDWDFFYACYERTYYEHGNAPYLSRDFFKRMQRDMPEHWLLFIAERAGEKIACSLIALDEHGIHPASKSAIHSGASQAIPKPFSSDLGTEKVAYGRYWGALERVDCLHFDACYHQPMAWCIAHGYARFEGGAQGEHKMARGLLPVACTSRHWLAQPQFAQAVDHFLKRERAGVSAYLAHLTERSPMKAINSAA